MSDDVGEVDATEAFTDTCVLFDYSMDERQAARELFDRHRAVQKVASPRIQHEFESVASRHQDIHRELQEIASEGDLDGYDSASIGERSNDLRYAGELYAELLALDDNVEVIRRLNELVKRLEKAKRALFGEEGLLIVLDIDGLDAHLQGLLSTVVGNQADVRIICDAVEWNRKGGSGTFLSADVKDILGDRDNTRGGSTGGKLRESDDLRELSETFEDFFGAEEKPLREQINDRIRTRFDADASLDILSVPEFVEILQTESTAT